jgi:Tfp pilus assembly protein PilX
MAAGRDVISRIRDERGQTLVFAVVAMLILALSIETLLNFTASNQRNASYQKSVQVARSLADAGINNAVSVLATAATPGNANNAKLIPSSGGCTSTLLPSSLATANSSTYSGGTVKYWGSFANASDCQNWIWTLNALSTVQNPTGPSASPIVKTASAQVRVHAPKPGTLQVGVWNTIYSPYGPTSGCDTTVAQSENIRVPLYVGGNLCVGNGALINAPVYVGGFLNFSNKQAQVGCTTANGNGCATPAPVHSAHVGGYCVVGTGGQVNPCKSEPVPGNQPNTNIWVQGAPNNLSGSASDFVGITAPQICWTVGTCAGDPAGGWYTVASPGPMHPCTTTAGTPPIFDNNGVMDQSVAGTFNLTPDSSDYTCRTSEGELSWNHTSRTLTVNGTIFIDGNVTATSSSQTPVTYTGWGSCATATPCDGVLYVSGTAYINGVKMCALVSSGNCDWNNWNPNAKILAILAHSQGTQQGVAANQGIVVGPSQTSFQGALYADYQVVTGQSAATQGPLVSGTQTVVSGQSFQGSFPPINILPISIQGPPQALWIDPAYNFG